MNRGRALIAKRHAQFALVVLASAVALRSPIGDLAKLSFRNGLYSHVPFVPVLIACVLYAKRESLFSRVEYSPGAGLALAAMGALFSAASFLFARGLTPDDRLSLLTVSLLLVWAGAFTFAYGIHTLTKALYPVLLALFMIPLPDFPNDRLVRLLQRTGRLRLSGPSHPWVTGVARGECLPLSSDEHQDRRSMQRPSLARRAYHYERRSV